MARDELEALWRDPRNYRWGVYYCKADPRIVVPKRYKWMGWTVNFARPNAIPVTILLIAILIVPAVLAQSWKAPQSVVYLVLALSIAVLCLLCAYLSSRTD